VEFRQVQGFVGVDVAQPSQEGLVEQERFELPVMSVQGLKKPDGGKLSREWFRSQILEDSSRVLHQPNAPEFARIGKDQAGILRQLQDQPVMCCRLVSAQDDQQVSAHTQMHKQVKRRELEVEEFSPTGNGYNLLTPDDFFKGCRGWGSQSARPAQVGRKDSPAGECRAQDPGNGFDLWEFRHLRIGTTKGK